MFTAIVLDEKSRAILQAFACNYCDYKTARLLCHHVTLAFGSNALPEGWTFGETREVTADAVGMITGRILAVRVSGVERPDGKIPHVSLATFGEGKPKEANAICDWQPLAVPVVLRGKVELCK